MLRLSINHVCCQVFTHSEGKDTAASSAADQPSRRRLPPLPAAGASPLAAWPCALIAIIRRGAAAAWRPAVQPIALVRVAPRASMVGALGGLQEFRMATQYHHKTGCQAGWCNGRLCCPAAARWEAWDAGAHSSAVAVSTKWRPNTSLVSNAAQLPAGGIQACALCRCSLAALESATNLLGGKPAVSQRSQLPRCGCGRHSATRRRSAGAVALRPPSLDCSGLLPAQTPPLPTSRRRRRHGEHPGRLV